MEVNDLERAAALAGVATVDLGGAGAGRRLEAGIAGSKAANPPAGDDETPQAPESKRDIWREVLFRDFSFGV